MCWNNKNGVIGVMVYMEFKDAKYIFCFLLKFPLYIWRTECASYHGICLVHESQQRTSGVEPCPV